MIRLLLLLILITISFSLLVIIQELYNFKQQNPSADLEPFLAKSSHYFRDYIERGLKTIESEIGGSGGQMDGGGGSGEPPNNPGEYGFRNGNRYGGGGSGGVGQNVLAEASASDNNSTSRLVSDPRRNLTLSLEM